MKVKIEVIAVPGCEKCASAQDWLRAVAVGWLEILSALSKFQRAFEVGGEILLILVSLYLLNAYFIVLFALAA